MALPHRPQLGERSPPQGAARVEGARASRVARTKRPRPGDHRRKPAGHGAAFSHLTGDQHRDRPALLRRSDNRRDRANDGAQRARGVFARSARARRDATRDRRERSVRRGKTAAILGISSAEECACLDKLNRAQERVLIDCFTALDGGATAEDCFARYPQRAESLHGYLAMRDQLLALKATTPSPTAFASGREALLAGVIRPLANGQPGFSTEAPGRQARGLFWRPAARLAIAGALLLALVGCALGVPLPAKGNA